MSNEREKIEKKKKTETEEFISGHISCLLTTLTLLFIPNTTKDDAFSKGEYANSYDFFSYEDLTDRNDYFESPARPIIPGSSIRGAIRGAYEAATNGCHPCTDGRDLCPACALFGMVGSESDEVHFDDSINKSRASRLMFKDAVPYELIEGSGWSSWYDSVRVLPILGAAKKPQNQRMQIRPVRDGKTFKFDISFDRITKNELDTLLSVLTFGGQNNTHAHKLGHGKSVGYGSVRITNTTVAVAHLAEDFNLLMQTQFPVAMVD